jgi:hypothetical protein
MTSVCKCCEEHASVSVSARKYKRQSYESSRKIGSTSSHILAQVSLVHLARQMHQPMVPDLKVARVLLL